MRGIGKDNSLELLHILHWYRDVRRSRCGSFTTRAQKGRDRTKSCFASLLTRDVEHRMWSLDSQVWTLRHISRHPVRVTILTFPAKQLPHNDLHELPPRWRFEHADCIGGRHAFTFVAHAGPWIATPDRSRRSHRLDDPESAHRRGRAGYESMQPMATRSDLTSLADRLARGSESDRNKASSLRARLRDGDFRPGDRIRLVIDGNITQDDTISVIAGSKVLLKDVGEIPSPGCCDPSFRTT